MTPALTPLQQQQKMRQPQPEQTNAETPFLPVSTIGEGTKPLLAFVIRKDINTDDPSQWDEAWFANYE